MVGHRQVLKNAAKQRSSDWWAPASLRMAQSPWRRAGRRKLFISNARRVSADESISDLPDRARSASRPSRCSGGGRTRHSDMHRFGYTRFLLRDMHIISSPGLAATSSAARRIQPGWRGNAIPAASADAPAHFRASADYVLPRTCAELRRPAAMLERYFGDHQLRIGYFTAIEARSSRHTALRGLFGGATFFVTAIRPTQTHSGQVDLCQRRLPYESSDASATKISTTCRIEGCRTGRERASLPLSVVRISRKARQPGWPQRVAQRVFIRG